MLITKIIFSIFNKTPKISQPTKNRCLPNPALNQAGAQAASQALLPTLQCPLVTSQPTLLCPARLQALPNTPLGGPSPQRQQWQLDEQEGKRGGRGRDGQQNQGEYFSWARPPLPIPTLEA